MKIPSGTVSPGPTAPATPAAKPAAHVQAAMAAAQAKRAAAVAPGRPLAAHVQAALAAAQPKIAKPAGLPGPAAPHVQAGLRAAQAKPANERPATAGPPAAATTPQPRPAPGPAFPQHRAQSLAFAPAIQRMNEEILEVHVCTDQTCEWFDISQYSAKCEGCGADFSYMELGELGQKTIENIANQISYWAKRRVKKDNSGHGKNKKIQSGHSSDRHQVGLDRKTKRKKKLTSSLEDALSTYKELGGNEGMLEKKIVKQLNQTGVKWKDLLE